MSTQNLIGTKLVEVPYFAQQLVDNTKSLLIIGERTGGEGVSETVKDLGFSDVTTTDIVGVPEDSWLAKNRGNWKHVQTDFIFFEETNKYDYIISISVFEHFGLWFFRNRVGNTLLERDDVCLWNHDIRGMLKACKLLKDESSKLIITIPAGPFMNYEPNGDPLLRSYDSKRQEIVKSELKAAGYSVVEETFFYSSDFVEWTKVDRDIINRPENYKYYNPGSPNVIWAFTVQKTA